MNIHKYGSSLLGTLRIARVSSSIAVVVTIALCAWSAGLHGWIAVAHAIDVTNFSDLVSSSQPSADANHTLEFTLTSAVDEGETLTVTFENGFDLSGIAITDIDIASSSDLTTAATCAAAEEVAVSIASQTITFEICAGDGGALATSSVITVEVGDHASAGANQIGNPATQDSYVISLGGTSGVTGATRVAIVDTINVSAIVTTTFDFAIESVGSATSTNGDAVLTSGTTTATSVPFGVLTAGVPKVLAQDLTVSTNARNGFTVTVQADQTLTSISGAEIDVFIDGSATGTPNLWVAPSANPGDSTTFGHWGITTEDASLSDGDSFGTALYVGDFVATPREVFYHGGIADGETPHIGRTRIGFKIETSLLQEAGSDYEAILTYIATPVF